VQVGLTEGLTNAPEGQSAHGVVHQTVVGQQSSTGRLRDHPFDQLFIGYKQSIKQSIVGATVSTPARFKFTEKKGSNVPLSKGSVMRLPCCHGRRRI